MTSTPPQSDPDPFNVFEVPYADDTADPSALPPELDPDQSNIGSPVIPEGFDPGTPGYITDAGSETGMAVTTSQPTQVTHPGKATVRTVVAYVAAVLLAGTVGLPIIADYFDAYLPPKVKSVVLATAGFCGVVIACATRLMAVPAVNALLSRIGLGAAK